MAKYTFGNIEAIYNDTGIRFVNINGQVCANISNGSRDVYTDGSIVVKFDRRGKQSAREWSRYQKFKQRRVNHLVPLISKGEMAGRTFVTQPFVKISSPSSIITTEEDFTAVRELVTEISAIYGLEDVEIYRRYDGEIVFHNFILSNGDILIYDYAI